jgi:hypothetical protein
LSLLQLYYRIAVNHEQLDSRLVQLCLADIDTVRLFRRCGHKSPNSGKAMLDTQNGVSFYRKPKLVVPSTAPLEFKGSESPDRVTYTLIKMIYSAFGHYEEAIPNWNSKEERFVFVPCE